MWWICCSLPYRQKAEELTVQLQRRNDEYELMSAKVAELETAFHGHQQVNHTLLTSVDCIYCEVIAAG